MKNTLFIIVVLTLTLPVYAAVVVPVSSTSPWEHAGSELTTPVTIVPGTSPLTYTTAFTREREIYGYNPRFMPTIVTFDKNNKPYMVTPVHSTNSPISHRSAYEGVFNTPTAYLQTLGSNGNWITYDIGEIIWDVYDNDEDDNPNYAAGHNYKDRVVFGENSLYFTIWEKFSLSGKTLIYSRDNFATVNDECKLRWKYNATLEVFDTFTSSERYLPTVADFNTTGIARNLRLEELSEDIFGNVNLGTTIYASPLYTSGVGPFYSGFLNNTVTIGDTVHCFWDSNSLPEPNYTQQYYSSYNRSTGVISEPYCLGSTYSSSSPDSINAPTVTVGRDKTLHVVLGGHDSQAKYTYSTDRGKTWSTPIDLPGDTNSSTFPTLVTDREDTQHLIYRGDASGKSTIGYARKKHGQSWQDMGVLIMPGREGTNQYYQTLTVDRLGRLFLHYWYRASGLDANEMTEYRTKWPTEPDPNDLNTAHDPVIIMSDDGGDTWRIATTQDFVDGLIDDTIPVAYYRLDKSGVQKDSTGNGHDLNTVNGSPAVVSGKIGNAAGFDGVSDGYVGAFDQNEVLTDGAFTLTGWFKVNPVPASLSYLVNAKGSSSEGFGLFIENQKFSGHIYATGLDSSISSPNSVVANQWTHVALTYAPDGPADGTGTYTGTLKLYIDGELEATVASKKYLPADANLALGQSATGGNYTACMADDVAIFTGAMPVQKIEELASEKYSPFNVSRELLYEGDLNEDGIVDSDDLTQVVDNWLVMP